MQVLDRIIIVIFAILLMFVSLVMMLSTFELIPQEYITNLIYQNYGQIEMGIVGLIFFIIAIRILRSLVRGNDHNRNAIVRENSLGQVRLSLSAIDALVREVVTKTRGVKELESRLRVNEEGLIIFLEVVVTPDINIPELTEDLQEQIREYLGRTTGVVANNIEILVDNIAQDSNLRVE
ncbi:MULTISPECIES: alkaline shock response membrane anchor protein AmaP [unclassified Candidatus Frackibacter]|uniref:alkaline shock response membrane anchor protein AmaP n=1 Tax=unclassified Candidatus Frackibacter TaxID=2648818 RepID=UPI0007987103|nr:MULTISPECIES: alkaline shock response membrane anchor protein AmaP [unclassified Candidatus Frackibacter]KXS37002.1 MAG: hypothetical protein AWU54_2348 [Candidatus Frackibacter sp. T328-2]SDC02894.1 hypothetical protein SAMN04515661_101352 [Candidatus Frackibacter sp. WG11]SEM69415.1 hypothetical protein SAMN04488698_11258 [Candidatus Frackibacter sp. WG12]SFL80676.1 hypothetical protein SAMN04488699_11458 [Candidatus Frackibacter sp. WG13]